MPQNLESVIDKFGAPPPEVALDWARQLIQIASTAEPSGGGDEPDLAAASSTPLQWSRFEVTESGELATIDVLAAGADSPKLHSMCLHSLCLQHAARLISWAGGSGRIDLPNDQIDRRSLSETIDRRVAAMQPAGKKQRSSVAVTADAAKTRSAALPKSKFSQRKLLSFTAAGIGAVGIVGWFVSSAFAPPHIEPSSQARASGGHRSAEHENSAENENKVQSKAGTSQLGDLLLLDDVLLSEDTTFSGDTENEVAALSESGELAIADDSTDSFLPLSQLSQSAAQRGAAAESGQPAVASETNSSVDPAETSEVLSNAAPSGAAQDAINVDVAGELEKLQKPTDDDAVTTIEVADSDKLQLAALSVPVFPSQQIVRIALPREVRVRKPAFELELQLADGFTIAPSGTQTITTSQTVFWQIRSDDEDSTTTVLIGGRLMPGRAPALRFQISATAPQTPGVVVPLSKDYLSRAETMLSGIRNQLSVGIDALHRSYDQTPKEMRSAMTTSRKAAEQQLDVCEKLFGLASQARSIEGLLDGQFEVHGRLLEAAGTPSTVIATIGKPTTMVPSDPPNG